jgi:hypothetical protein
MFKLRISGARGTAAGLGIGNEKVLKFEVYLLRSPWKFCLDVVVVFKISLSGNLRFNPMVAETPRLNIVQPRNIKFLACERK